MNHMSRN